jgi:hypothetical protein
MQSFSSTLRNQMADSAQDLLLAGALQANSIPSRWLTNLGRMKILDV